MGNGLLQRCNFSRCHRWCQGQQLVDRLGAGVPQQGVMHFTSGAVCVVSRIPGPSFFFRCEILIFSTYLIF